jgi:hypothetical protein
MVTAAEFFSLSNPLFLDGVVSVVLYAVYRLLLKRFPRIAEGIKEASLVFLVFMFYDASRYFALNAESVAKHNAELVIAFENKTHLDIEIPLQKMVLKHPDFAKFLNSFYLGAHWGGLVIFFVWAYARVLFAPAAKRERRRSEYVTARGRFIIMNILAAISFMAYPCAPPRYFTDLGYVDTLQSVSKTDVYSNTRRFVNPFAAMPSMHQGYSLLFALTIVIMLRSEIFASATEADDSDEESAPNSPVEKTLDFEDSRRAAVREYFSDFARRYRAYRVLSPETRRSPRRLQLVALLPCVLIAYPMFMFVVIVGTGNHFTLDALAGASAFALACLLTPLVGRLIKLVDERIVQRASLALTQASVRMLGEKGVDIEMGGVKGEKEEKQGFLAETA